MYISNLRRVRSSATRPRRYYRLTRKIYSSSSGAVIVRGFSKNATNAGRTAAAEAVDQGASWNLNRWSNVIKRLRQKGKTAVPSASSVAGAVALVPVAGGLWLVTVYAMRQRLCEHHLQKVRSTILLDQVAFHTWCGVTVPSRT